MAAASALHSCVPQRLVARCSTAERSLDMLRRREEGDVSGGSQCKGLKTTDSRKRVGGWVPLIALWDLPYTAKRHEPKRCVIGGQSQNLLDLGIIESSHQHGRKTSCGGLKVHILRRVSDLNVDVATAPLAVLPSRALIHACNGKHGRRTSDPSLAEGCRG